MTYGVVEFLEVIDPLVDRTAHDAAAKDALPRRLPFAAGLLLQR